MTFPDPWRSKAAQGRPREGHEGTLQADGITFGLGEGEPPCPRPPPCSPPLPVVASASTSAASASCAPATRSSTTSRSTSNPASWSPSSVPAVQASRRCSTPWPAFAPRAPAACASMASPWAIRACAICSATSRKPTSSTATYRWPRRCATPPGCGCRVAPRRKRSTAPSPTHLAQLDLTHRASTRVGDLSGGQRKRTSIAVELLTRPRAFFLDEPTSGLDPATAASLMLTLRGLADQGTTIVLTTHNTDDLRSCDRMVVVADGTVVFIGSPTEARCHFGVEHLADIYLRSPAEWPARACDDARSEAAPPAPPASPAPWTSSTPTADRAGATTQWAVLARRNLDLLRHNRLTLAIMLGAPALVIAMFTMLFRPGALDRRPPRRHGGRQHHLLDGLRRLLLRAHVWPAPDRHRDGHPAARDVRRPADRLVPGRQDHGARARPRRRRRRHARSAPGPRSAPATGYPRLRPPRCHPRRHVDRRAHPRAAGLGRRRRPAQATLALPILCFPAVLFAGPSCRCRPWTSAAAP